MPVGVRDGHDDVRDDDGLLAVADASSDASSTAKRPASTVEVRRGGITPLSSSSTGVQVAPVFSLTTPAKGWFHSTTDQGAYVHAGDVLVPSAISRSRLRSTA